MYPGQSQYPVLKQTRASLITLPRGSSQLVACPSPSHPKQLWENPHVPHGLIKSYFGGLALHVVESWQLLGDDRWQRLPVTFTKGQQSWVKVGSWISTSSGLSGGGGSKQWRGGVERRKRALKLLTGADRLLSAAEGGFPRLRHQQPSLPRRDMRSSAWAHWACAVTVAPGAASVLVPRVRWPQPGPHALLPVLPQQPRTYWPPRWRSWASDLITFLPGLHQRGQQWRQGQQGQTEGLGLPTPFGPSLRPPPYRVVPVHSWDALLEPLECRRMAQERPHFSCWRNSLITARQKGLIYGLASPKGRDR